MTMSTVLALPGLLCDRLVWERQITGLTDVADVVVPAYPDCDDLADMARVALSTTDGPVSIVGHSMGARVALEAWALAPERIDRLALLDTGVHGVRPDEHEGRRRLTDLSASDGMAALADAWLPPMVHPSRRNDTAFMAPMHTMVQRNTPEQHAAQIRALMGRRDQTSVLASVTVPTLIAVGRSDEWSPVDQHEAMLEQVPHARFVVIEKCGHMATVEQPEVVTDLLRSWLGA